MNFTAQEEAVIKANAAQVNRELENNRRASSAQEREAKRQRRRRSSFLTISAFVDTTKDHGTTRLVAGRESHTANLQAYDELVENLKNMERYDNDEAFEPKLWEYIRKVLEHGVPTGFNSLASNTESAPMGPREMNAFIEKFKTLGMVNPIYPKAVADAAGISLHSALTELLYAAQQTGLVTLMFAPECSRCGAAACLNARLGHLPPKTVCIACGYGNAIESLDKIKVLFILNDNVLYAPADNLGCPPVPAAFANTEIFAPIPATSTGSGFSYSVGCDSIDGSKNMICPALKPGRYRMRCPISTTDGFLVVEEEAKSEDKPVRLDLKVSDMLIKEHLEEHSPDATESPFAKFKTVTVPHGKIIFQVLPDTSSFFILWVQKDQDEDAMLRLPKESKTEYASAADVIQHPSFNILFRDQVVADGGSQGLTPHGASLSLARVVLVFTDVVGSTELYSSVGDGQALNLVRQHYEVLFGAFTKRGRVVKTIGDAVMASFTSARDALLCVAAALREMERKRISCPTSRAPVQIRVGVHAGPCVVVPLNGINDYFGQTVNIAARTEGAARAGECLVTESTLREDPSAMAAFDELVAKDYIVATSIGSTDLTLKGVVGSVRARGFRVKRQDE